ncbi:MaoC family dehydratase [Actinophytocola gossypii]|uniref:N-terminal of MaoC-like dehydratase domain-containing protein n=1 Tax=Actinophytocola gossypii TaxID=2812003 RepID=A0ABT2JDC4_9PSEU|nr:hypothetical protein [Actinophytocola gossypii]MCT2585883.1 hypothetical protein [Actinophytocola gossypii]
MTRPSDVKPREGDLPGTRWDDFEIGAELPSFSFTISPEIVAEYSRAIENDPNGYVLDGKRVAIPSILSVYLMATLYRRYPPTQGGIMAGNKFRYYGLISADSDTTIVGSGEILDKFEKRGRRYVRYVARFTGADGKTIAEAENISTFPN